MDNLIYRFMKSIKYKQLPLAENERKFALYVLAQANPLACQNVIFSNFSLKDAFYFLCDGKEDIEELRRTTNNLFKAFSVKMEEKRKSTSLNLLDSVIVNPPKCQITFNLKCIKEWLNFQEKAK